MAPDEFLCAEIAEHRAVLEAMSSAEVCAAFAALAKGAIDTAKRGGKIILFGNGGSAGDAQHLATELTVRYRRNRPAIAALALTTDTSALTAIGNDLGFDELFSRQIEALARQEDLVIAISTSGNSPNVLRGLTAARQLGCATAGLTGNDGGRMPGLCDHLLVVPSRTTARIQEMHIMIGHALCDSIEQGLGYA